MIIIIIKSMIYIYIYILYLLACFMLCHVSYLSHYYSECIPWVLSAPVTHGSRYRSIIFTNKLTVTDKLCWKERHKFGDLKKFSPQLFTL